MPKANCTNVCENCLQPSDSMVARAVNFSRTGRVKFDLHLGICRHRGNTWSEAKRNVCRSLIGLDDTLSDGCIRHGELNLMNGNSFAVGGCSVRMCVLYLHLRSLCRDSAVAIICLESSQVNGSAGGRRRTRAVNQLRGSA